MQHSLELALLVLVARVDVGVGANCSTSHLLRLYRANHFLREKCPLTGPIGLADIRVAFAEGVEYLGQELLVFGPVQPVLP